jgi:hypothetical protein
LYFSLRGAAASASEMRREPAQPADPRSEVLQSEAAPPAGPREFLRELRLEVHASTLEELGYEDANSPAHFRALPSPVHCALKPH